MAIARIAVLSLLLALLAACRRSGPPFHPSDALRTFQIEPGFRIELFAAEPDVAAPVAMDWDEDGRIYVVESPGYPLNIEGKVGKVKLLEDTNGDGRPDRSTVFADRLVLPTGVMRWKKGILVTDAPHVWYMEDTNGDGRADIRQILLTGFAFTNPQHTVNSPTYGLDNWIYLSHEGSTTAVIFADKFGDRGGEIRFADRPAGPKLKIERRNVRFRPDAFELEYLSGTSQFGYTIDEWGRHFSHNNSNHIRHEVIAARYLKRNPDLLLASAMQDISDHGSNAPVFPIVQRPRVEMLTNAGEFTSACGLTIYQGGAMPWSGRVALVAEPAHNLVHRDVLSPAGSTFVARRSADAVEFLASTDPWFRPVNFYVGPDGALYLMDYYRQIIEHPEWTSEHVHHSPDLYRGSDRGRIYRVTPQSGLPFAGKLQLSRAPFEQLALYLAGPNIWWRRTAQRLLVDRRDPAAVAPLVRLLEANRSPLGRLHALWTLEGLGKLDDRLIEKALADEGPGVRESAIVLAESRLSVLLPKLLARVEDPDPHVRFQLLCTLGSVDSPASHAAQETLLRRDFEDRWFQIAALSASSDRTPQWLGTMTRDPGDRSRPEVVGFLRLVASVIGARARPAEIRRVLNMVSPAPAWRAAALEGLAQGLRGKSVRGVSPDPRLLEDTDRAVRRAALQLFRVTGLPTGPRFAPIVQRATHTAASPAADPEIRADSLALLALAGPMPYEPLLKKLIDPRQPEQVQAAAVRALVQIKDESVAPFLIQQWRSMTSAARAEAAQSLSVEPTRARLLVDAIRKGEIQPWTLSFGHKRNLIMHRDPEIRAAARPLLEEKAGDREAVIRRYEAALAITGNAARGRQVFERVCAKCHKFQDLGSEVGPDLGTVRNRAPQMLLPDILLPSRSISQNYETYVVETVSGGNFEGVLGSQTPNAIALRHEQGKEDVIARSDIKRMYVTNLSAMPEDLDKQIDVREMADLLQFLKTGSQPGR